MTFTVGFLTGVYAYFVSRPPIEINDNEPIASNEGEFEVIADMYGGCSKLDACSSYRLIDTGEYTFVQRSRNGDDERFQGEISGTQLALLTRLFENTDIESIQDSLFEGTCPAAYDGLGYVFTIYHEGEEYAIDTCIEDTGGEPLFEKLESLFEVLNSEHGG